MAHIADPCPDCGGMMSFVEFGRCLGCGSRFEGRRETCDGDLDLMHWEPYREWRKEPGDGE
jgi:hypothetical protein